MTPEELQAAKEKWNKIAGRTFGISDYHAINRDCAAVLPIIPDLLTHIDEQANQIKQLKSTLIEQKAIDQLVHPDRWQKLPEEEKEGYRQDARQQLREEMPGIFEELE